MPDAEVLKPDAALELRHEQPLVEQSRFMPVMSMAVAVERRNIIVQAVKNLMREDQDYGKIPGTNKPTLLQPGADKLNNLFGLVAHFTMTEREEDWTGERHGGEPFFAYNVKCLLYRGDFLMGEGDGSCNSWESKYRYRKAERVCPQCGKDAIIKGKSEYGGGWLCFARKGGCGAKFKPGDPAIESQEVGRVANPEIFDVVNTIMKMANKRAKIAATLNATSAHEFFTQDVEDMPLVQERPPETKSQAANPADGMILPANPPQAIDTQIKSRLAQFASMRRDIGDKEYYRILGAFGYEHANEIRTRDAAVPVWREMAAVWDMQHVDAQEQK